MHAVVVSVSTCEHSLWQNLIYNLLKHIVKYKELYKQGAYGGVQYNDPNTIIPRVKTADI